jgi:hypothetical protein
MKLRWYADNSEMVGWRGAQIQDVFMFGGIVVDHDQEPSLRKQIEDIKSQYGLRRAPLKWNFKDLKDLYKREGIDKLHRELLDSSKDWRTELLRLAISAKLKIVIACIEAYSLERKIIKLRKQGIAQYAFSNALQRVALHSKQSGAGACEIVLDWPDKGDPQPFCKEYSTAFKDGKTTEGHTYHSGPLSVLGFSDTPMFQNMENSSLLQLADLVVGAVREYIEYALDKRSDGLGVDLTREMKNLFYGAPNNICGWGLVVAGASEFRHKIKSRVDAELLCRVN